MPDKDSSVTIHDNRIASVVLSVSGGEVQWAVDPPPGTHFRLTRCRKDNENLGLTVITDNKARHWLVSTVRDPAKSS